MWLPFEKEGEKKLKAQENAVGSHYSTRVFKKNDWRFYSYALQDTFKTGLGHAM